LRNDIFLKGSKCRLSDIRNVRFQILMAASLKMAAFWDIASCSLLEVYRFFRAVCTFEMSVYFNETTWCCIEESLSIRNVLVTAVNV
jgi:hypothetical protein